MLILHNAGREPLGQFDGYTGETTTFLGGEVCTWHAMLQSTAQTLGAADVPNDGYINEGGFGLVVPAISKAWSATAANNVGPYFLSDDGLKGYGTIFGTVVGRSVGETSYGPGSTVASADLLGPHTATGSGKITIWDKPGLYGVTLDAVDSAGTGLVPTNTSLRVGSKLGFTSGGLLTLKGSANDVAPSAATAAVGYLASFETNGSVVTTPMNLVAALNSPSGSVSSLQQLKFTQVVFNFVGSAGTGQ